MPDDFDSRTVLTPRTGTKVCLLIGVALLLVAIYFFFVPLTSVRTDSGAVFGCGSAASPSGGSFAGGVCGKLPSEYRFRAIMTAVLALVTLIGGSLLFGFDRHTDNNRLRSSGNGDRDDYDEFDDFDSDDRSRRGSSDDDTRGRSERRRTARSGDGDRADSRREESRRDGDYRRDAADRADSRRDADDVDDFDDDAPRQRARAARSSRGSHAGD